MERLQRPHREAVNQRDPLDAEHLRQQPLLHPDTSQGRAGRTATRLTSEAAKSRKLANEWRFSSAAIGRGYLRIVRAPLDRRGQASLGWGPHKQWDSESLPWLE